jgi:hypothetical protein
METLFIPSLLTEDYRSFFIKLIIVFALWIIAITATIIDLKTGIDASKRLGNFKTTSSGLRQTLRKDFQYFTLLIIALLFDVVFSYLTTLTDIFSFLGLFRIPIFTILSVIIVLLIEFISVKENLRKGSKEVVPQELINKALEIISELGDDKVKAISKILKTGKDEQQPAANN